jgi:hypothetical protein
MLTSVSICTFVLVKQLIFCFAHQRAAAAPLTMYLTYGSEQVLSYFFFWVPISFYYFLFWPKKGTEASRCSVCSVCLLLLVQKYLLYWYKSAAKLLQKSYKSPRKVLRWGVQVTERFFFFKKYYKSAEMGSASNRAFFFSLCEQQNEMAQRAAAVRRHASAGVSICTFVPVKQVK